MRRWQIDPSAGIIRLLEMSGLAWDVVRVSPERKDSKALAERRVEPAGWRSPRRLPCGVR